MLCGFGSPLGAFLIVTAVYDVRVFNIARPTQVAMSVIGFAAYIFALVGWFATMSWYQPWYAALVLPAFALLVAIVRLKPLPQPVP